MRFSHLHPSYHLSHLLDNYDFGTGECTIVDIGGSDGEVSTEIASRYPQIRCIVQDLPETIADWTTRVPTSLQDRVTCMAHDFLTPQPVHGADVYLLRWILHDWSDKYCVRILRNLVPALKKGARVVVNDICIPEPGELGPKADRDLRYVFDLFVICFVCVSECLADNSQVHGHRYESVQQRSRKRCGDVGGAVQGGG